MDPGFIVGLSVGLAVLLILILAFGCRYARKEKENQGLAAEKLLGSKTGYRHISDRPKSHQPLKRLKTVLQYRTHALNKHGDKRHVATKGNESSMEYNKSDTSNQSSPFYNQRDRFQTGNKWNEGKQKINRENIDCVLNVHEATDDLKKKNSNVGAGYVKLRNYKHKADTAIKENETRKTNRRQTDHYCTKLEDEIEIETDETPLRRKLSVKQIVEEVKRKSSMGQQYGTCVSLSNNIVNAKNDNILSIESQKNHYLPSLSKQNADKAYSYSKQTYKTESNSTAQRPSIDMKSHIKQPTCNYKPADLYTFGYHGIHGKGQTEKEIQQSRGITVHSFIGNTEEGAVSGNGYRLHSYDREIPPLPQYYHEKEHQSSPDNHEDTSYDSFSDRETISSYTQSPERCSLYKQRDHSQPANKEIRKKEAYLHHQEYTALPASQIQYPCRINETHTSLLPNMQTHSKAKQYTITNSSPRLRDFSPDRSPETHRESRLFKEEMVPNMKNIVGTNTFEQQSQFSKFKNNTEQVPTYINNDPQNLKTFAYNADAHEIKSTSMNNYAIAKDQSVKVIHEVIRNDASKSNENDKNEDNQVAASNENFKTKVLSDINKEQQGSPDGSRKQTSMHVSGVSTPNNDSKFNDDSLVAERKDIVIKSSLDNILSESEFNPGQTSTPQQSETNFPENKAATTFNRIILPLQQDNESNSPPKGNTETGDGFKLHSILKKRRGAIAVSSEDISQYFNDSSFWDDEGTPNDKSTNAEDSIHECEAEEQPEASANNYSQGMLLCSLPEKIATVKGIREDPDVSALYKTIKAKRKSSS